MRVYSNGKMLEAPFIVYSNSERGQKYLYGPYDVHLYSFIGALQLVSITNPVEISPVYEKIDPQKFLVPCDPDYKKIHPSKFPLLCDSDYEILDYEPVVVLSTMSFEDCEETYEILNYEGANLSAN